MKKPLNINLINNNKTYNIASTGMCTGYVYESNESPPHYYMGIYLSLDDEYICAVSLTKSDYVVTNESKLLFREVEGTLNINNS